MDFITVSNSGLQIPSRAEIYNTLSEYARSAYGNDLSLDEGSAFSVFLGLLADGLSTVNGAVQSFSELFSTKELSGNFLDFVAGRRGVVRKTKQNQRVTVTVELKEGSYRPFFAGKGTIFVTDSVGRTWVNTTQLQIVPYKFSSDGSFTTEPNYQGTCTFGLQPLDGYDANLLYALNNGTGDLVLDTQKTGQSVQSVVSRVCNYENATPAVSETETDAQLRARYDQAVYSGSVATLDGLRSQLLKYSDYVKIVENSSNSSSVDATNNPYGIGAHSIWCIVGGTSSFNNTEGGYSTDASDISIAQTILNYKSLGCGVSVSSDVVGGTVSSGGSTSYTGNFACAFPMGTMTAVIPFTRLVDNAVTFSIGLTYTGTLSDDLKSSVTEKISLALQSYVSGLQPGEVITTVDTVNAIYGVLSQYEVGKFDFVSSSVSYADGTGIAIYQRASWGSASVAFSGGSN